MLIFNREIMSEEKKNLHKGHYLAIGMALGLGVGAAMGNIPIGLCIGLALGTAFGHFHTNKDKEDKE